MTPLQTVHLIAYTEDMAKRNGFKLDISTDIGIKAYGKAPYAEGALVKVLASFEEVVLYFQGYEQLKFEQKELDRKAKVSK